ncbi:HEPN domain-containing protein [Chryseobacterium sp. MYb328]|uniref:HEPN domain-containing protein n=1 Tax=Chryseobacterium sp. MYb328 TaxID=2745231 RepID=UPI0030B179D9
MKKEELITRINLIIDNGNKLLNTKTYSEFSDDFVDAGLYAGFRTLSLSFIANLFGENHTYYKEFTKLVDHNYFDKAKAGLNILYSIRHEIELDWLKNIKRLVTAELFSDFLEMSKYLLDEKYKDPAAVMIGSVLEEHLRKLCESFNVETVTAKGDDFIPKKANVLNAELTKAGVYGILEQKNITAWLDLRNRAAHGKYSEYTIDQVNLMYQGVLNFILQTN